MQTWPPCARLSPDDQAATGIRVHQSSRRTKGAGSLGVTKADAVRFKIDYLECVKRLLAANGTADEFARALRAAYPELPGEAGLDALAQALYADLVEGRDDALLVVTLRRLALSAARLSSPLPQRRSDLYGPLCGDQK